MKTGAAGFTIVELLTVLAVAAVLVSVAMPSLSQLNANNRMVAEMNQLAGALRKARNEALKRGANVEICAARSTAGIISCDNAAAWDEGWIIYPAATPSARIAVFGGFGGGDTLQSLDGNHQFTFNRYGFSGLKDTLVLCPPGADESVARALLLEPSGRVVAASDGDGNGVVDDIDGNDISCPSTP